MVVEATVEYLGYRAKIQAISLANVECPVQWVILVHLDCKVILDVELMETT